MKKVIHSSIAPFICIVFVMLTTVLELFRQGRLWICSCGRVQLWTSETWSSDNSQHFSDPYSFSHLQHGLVFYLVFTKLFSKLHFGWRLLLAVIVESAWEVFENSQFVINRYRESTAALGYTGDTIINSFGDIAFCIGGFVLAKFIGVKKTLLVFLIIEVIMIILIRDSLLLNILMLIHPIKAVKVWQMGG